MKKTKTLTALTEGMNDEMMSECGVLAGPSGHFKPLTMSGLSSDPACSKSEISASVFWGSSKTAAPRNRDGHKLLCFGRGRAAAGGEETSTCMRKTQIKNEEEVQGQCCCIKCPIRIS